MLMRRVLLIAGAVLAFTDFARAEVSLQLPEPASQGAPSPEAAAEWLLISGPADNFEMISRRPAINGEFAVPVMEGSLLIVLDGVDVTQLAAITPKGFSYKPVLVMPSGSHNLVVSAKSIDGTELQKSISFSTRHTNVLDEAGVNNELTMNFEGDLARHNASSSAPSWKVENNLRSESYLKNKGFFSTFTTNVRYLDQNTPIATPLKKGFNVADWLLTLGYAKDKLSVLGNLGDVQVNETPYTVSNLARRGAVISAAYDRYELRLFDVKSEQVYGFRGGVGAGTGTDDHIIGISGGAKLFDNRLQARVVYASGGETGTSYNISDPAVAKRGTVLGFLVTSDFFQNMFTTELESAFSSFDPDTSDEFASKSSQAYRARVAGVIGIYNYDAQYERVGREFVPIGNLTGVQKDKEGFSARGGFTTGPHIMNVNFSRYNDNLDKDFLFARVYNYQGGVDYTNTQFASFPFSIGYQKSLQESEDEPAGAVPVDVDTDSLTGRVSYVNGGLYVNFITAYSTLNDRTSANNDTTSVSYTFNPSYTMQNISLSGNLQLNQTTPRVTDDTTSTYTVNLDLRSIWLQDRLAWDLAGTYTLSNNDSGTIDSENFTANMRIAYTLRNWLGFITPSFGVRGSYIRNIDHVNHSAGSEEYAVLGVVSAAVPFFF